VLEWDRNEKISTTLWARAHLLPQRSSKSLCSVDGTCMTPHASAGTSQFKDNFKTLWNEKSARLLPHRNLPPPPSEPSSTTAAPRRRGACNVTAPPSHLRGALWKLEKKLHASGERELTSLLPHSHNSPCSGQSTCTRPQSSAKASKFKQTHKICVKKNQRGPLPHLNPPPSPDGAVVHDGSFVGAGDWNATEPPANAHDRTKFNNWNFTSKLFSRNQEQGACSMSIQPTSGWSCHVRWHTRRGRRYGSRQHSYLVRKHLGSKLKSNLSECSYLHSSIRCRIRTLLPDSYQRSTICDKKLIEIISLSQCRHTWTKT
jgi:hypothetical protein